MDSAHAAYRGCPAGKRGHHCCAGTRRPWYFWLYAGLSVCVTLAIRTARKGHGPVGCRARADAMCWPLERGRIRVLTARRGAVQVGVDPRPLGASQKRGSQAFSCGQQDRNASLDAVPKGAGQSIVHCPSKLCSRDSESWARRSDVWRQRRCRLQRMCPFNAGAGHAAWLKLQPSTPPAQVFAEADAS